MPNGYASVPAFNHALARYITEDLDLVHKPKQQASHDGWKYLDLQHLRDGVVTALLAALRATVDGYIESLPQNQSHPFLTTAPQEVRLSVWTIVFREQGHEEPYIHEGGWLSGVYYVRVPASVVDDDPQRRGWISFGKPGPFRDEHSGATRHVRPEEGMCLLFPSSYYYHHTMPSRSGEERICVAFDVAPLSAGSYGV